MIKEIARRYLNQKGKKYKNKARTSYFRKRVSKKPLPASADSLMFEKINKLSEAMEKMKLAEYVALLNKPMRLLYINFISGLARGVGMAIGFAILGALILYALQRLAILNLPVIGGLIAELVRIVQGQLKLQ